MEQLVSTFVMNSEILDSSIRSSLLQSQIKNSESVSQIS